MGNFLVILSMNLQSLITAAKLTIDYMKNVEPMFAMQFSHWKKVYKNIFVSRKCA